MAIIRVSVEIEVDGDECEMCGENCRFLNSVDGGCEMQLDILKLEEVESAEQGDRYYRSRRCLKSTVVKEDC